MLPLVQEPNSRSDVFGCTVADTHIYPPRTRCYSIDYMDGEAFDQHLFSSSYHFIH